MRPEENLASVSGVLGRLATFAAPPLTPLLAPMPSPSEKQFPISNQAGLPASPFRTDDWPVFSAGKR